MTNLRTNLPAWSRRAEVSFLLQLDWTDGGGNLTRSVDARHVLTIMSSSLRMAVGFTSLLGGDTHWELKRSNCPRTHRSCNLPNACGT